MKRAEYLEVKNYQALHEFINFLIHESEIKAEEYIVKKGYGNHLLEKKVSSARASTAGVTYSLTYTFFEDAEEVHLKENDVYLTFNVTVLPNDQFNIETSLESVYELKDYTKYFNLDALSAEVKEQFLELPSDFKSVLKRFFEKALDRFGNPDEMHKQLQQDEEV